MKIQQLRILVKLSDGSVRELSTTRDMELSVINLISKTEGLKVCKESLTDIELNYPDGSTLEQYVLRHT